MNNEHEQAFSKHVGPFAAIDLWHLISCSQNDLLPLPISLLGLVVIADVTKAASNFLSNHYHFLCWVIANATKQMNILWRLRWKIESPLQGNSILCVLRLNGVCLTIVSHALANTLPFNQQTCKSPYMLVISSSQFFMSHHYLFESAMWCQKLRFVFHFITIIYSLFFRLNGQVADMAIYVVVS